MTIAVVIAVLLALLFLSDLYHRNVCVACGGRDAHRDGCPFDRE